MHLYELIGSASLYHGTSYFNAVQIVQDNAFRDKTEHDFPSIGVVTGISFSRNRRFAMDWGWLAFELDRDRLAHRHKLIPLNYWQHGNEKSRSLGRDEAEEFVIGAVPHADRYITALHMTTKSHANLLKLGGPHIEFYDAILKHPLLKIT
jgi:hypothetical protein